MADNSVAGVAKQTVSSVRTFVVGQVDTQIGSLGQQLQATSESLRGLGEHARQDPNVAISAQLAEQGSAWLDRAAEYLQSHKAEHVAGDLEAFSRRQPLVATLAATALGFAISRAVKASSARRLNEGNV